MPKFSLRLLLLLLLLISVVLVFFHHFNWATSLPANLDGFSSILLKGNMDTYTTSEPHRLFGGRRIGILGVLPLERRLVYVAELAAFLYSSWLNIHEGVRYNGSKDIMYNKIDLLIFAEKENLKKLLPGCVLVQSLEQLNPLEPQCLYFLITEIRHPYSYINTYGFLNSPFLRNLTSVYDYFIRTDLDVFLSPALLTYRPTKPLITGRGGYCVEFTRTQLERVAARLGYRHRHIHNTGSTWFGKAELVANWSAHVANLTMKIFDTEFDPKVHPEIAPFMNYSVHGKWAEWWRPTSALYGQEIILNHFLEDISYQTIQGDLLDVESCRSSSISKHLHVHTWHSSCQFNKFEFLKQFEQGQVRKGVLLVKLKYAKRKPVNSMPVHDYCTHIAEHALFHLAEWFADYVNTQ